MVRQKRENGPSKLLCIQGIKFLLVYPEARDDKPGPFCQARASGTEKFPSPG